MASTHICGRDNLEVSLLSKLFPMFSRFKRVWQAELVRRYEMQHGYQKIAAIEHSAQQQQTIQQRVLTRAALLAERLGLNTELKHWHHLRQLVAAGVVLIAILVALGLVQSMLSSTPPISLIFALLVLLGLNALMLALWLVSLPIKDAWGWVGKLSWFAMQRSGSKQRQKNYSHALLTLANEHGLTKPAGAVLTHGYWLLVMVVTCFILFFKLSGSSYTFTWASTIWSDASVQQWVEVLGWLPQQFSITAPSVDALWQQSDSHHVHLAAGRWLLSCVVLYGVLPRLVLLILAILVLVVRVARVHVDLSAPGMNRVVANLTGTRTAHVVDADTHSAAIPSTKAHAQTGQGTLIVSLDHEADAAWEQQASTTYHGVVNTATEKRQLLALLDATPVAQLIVRIDTRLSPDRTSMRYLNELRSHSVALTVELVTLDHSIDLPRVQHWQEALEQENIAWQ